MLYNSRLITPAQSLEARENLSLPQNVVVSGVKSVDSEITFTKTYLSEFESGARNLPPKTLRCLRDFYESQGHEFDIANPPAITADLIHPLSAMQPTNYIFPVDSSIRPEVLANALDMIGEADARLADLMKQEAKRNDGFLLGDGELTEETKATLQEVFSLMASNYLIVRMLRRWTAFSVTPSDDLTPQTLKDIVRETFYPKLVDAGLIESESAKEGDDDEKETA